MAPIHITPWLIALSCLWGASDVAERPLVQEVIYKNAHHISLKQLAELTGIRQGTPLDPAANNMACRTIEDFLKKRGRFWVTVTLAEGDKATDRRVIFNVTEGPIVRIRSTNFVGNKLLTAKELHKVVDGAPELAGFSTPFTQASIMDGVVRLESLYRARGCPGVKIHRRLVFSEDLSQADVTYNIDEGTPGNGKDATPTPHLPPNPGHVPPTGFMRLPTIDVPSDLAPFTFGVSQKCGDAPRTKVRFTSPVGMKIHFCTTDASLAGETCYSWVENFPNFTARFQAPVRGLDRLEASDSRDNYTLWPMPPESSNCSLAQGQSYTVTLTNIDHHVRDFQVSATLDVMTHVGKSKDFLSRNTIPIEFSDDDFKKVIEASSVVKVYRLRNPLHDNANDAESQIEVSTHPGWAIEGVDPIHEARQRGSVMLVIRLGIGQIFSATLAATPPPPMAKRELTMIELLSSRFR